LNQKQYQEHLRKLQMAYSRVFDSADGQIVLKDLRMRFYDRNLEDENAVKMATKVGNHTVVGHILTMKKENPDA